MRTKIGILAVVFICMAWGCETVHEGTKKAGTYVGKGVSAAGGITEGAAEGYKGSETQEENPFER
ncbi:MAG: hypothetical protein WC450_07600 [Candidatus Omnitrophota bacterium]|jgi:hypothetical protein